MALALYKKNAAIQQDESITTDKRAKEKQALFSLKYKLMILNRNIYNIAIFDLTLDDFFGQCRFNGMGKQPPQWTSPEIGIESLI